MNTTAEKIMDIAERLIRSRGYKGFAYREIATKIGIKSASVHYYFPCKGDLAEAIMNRYINNFQTKLETLEIQNPHARDRIEKYIEMYREEIRSEKTMPLCIMLGSDIENLPETVVDALRVFFDSNLSWLKRIIIQEQSVTNEQEAAIKSSHLLASLNGALMGARSLNNIKYFDVVASEALRQFSLIPEPA